MSRKKLKEKNFLLYVSFLMRAKKLWTLQRNRGSKRNIFQLRVPSWSGTSYWCEWVSSGTSNWSDIEGQCPVSKSAVYQQPHGDCWHWSLYRYYGITVYYLYFHLGLGYTGSDYHRQSFAYREGIQLQRVSLQNVSFSWLCISSSRLFVGMKVWYFPSEL